MTAEDPQFELRSKPDRIRHAVFFEVILVAIFVPLGAYFFEQSFVRVGAMSIGLSLIAMSANYLFNIAFDHALLRLHKPLQPRSVRLRMVHALLFEITLLVFSVPMVAYALQIGLLSALLLDIGFLVITPIFTFAYNWAYDVIFPMKSRVPQVGSSSGDL
jgi:uncharacterized membrane protein